MTEASYILGVSIGFNVVAVFLCGLALWLSAKHAAQARTMYEIARSRLDEANSVYSLVHDELLGLKTQARELRQEVREDVDEGDWWKREDGDDA